MKSFATSAVHGPLPGSAGHGALRPPVYDSVSFAFASSRDIADSFAGRRPAHAYSRISNPTVEELERRVLLLAGGQGVVALSSGMAAISAVVLTLAGAGSNIVASRFLFGNTASLLTHTLAPWGLETRFVDMTDHRSVAAAMDRDTRALFLESISNPQLEVCDIPALAALARERGVPLLLDNTATTFHLCRAGELGADIEILSSSKYISGGGTSLGGLIIDHGSFAWHRSPRLASAAGQYGPFAFLMALRREVCRNLGACLSPHAASLQILGLETLALRVEKSCANAGELALFLREQPAVRAVNYPGLADHPQHGLACRQFAGRCGGILTFDLADNAACLRFLDRLRTIRLASNINDNKSLALHPASTIFAEFTPKERQAMGVRETMLRISAGIEDPGDLKEDLRQALAGLGS